MKRLIASFALLSLVAAPALATTTKTPDTHVTAKNDKAAKKQAKAAAKQAKAANKNAVKDAKSTAKSN